MRNNNIHTFESSSEIQGYLKEQFAGLFQSFLDSNARTKDLRLSQKLEELAGQLKTLSEQFQTIKDEMGTLLHSNQYVSHPVVVRISSLLHIQFGVWFDDFQKLNELMLNNGWDLVNDNNAAHYKWQSTTSIANTMDFIYVSKSLFDDAGLLISPLLGNALDELVFRRPEAQKSADLNDNPPF